MDLTRTLFRATHWDCFCPRPSGFVSAGRIGGGEEPTGVTLHRQCGPLALTQPSR